jgi:hypothetical protein
MSVRSPDSILISIYPEAVRNLADQLACRELGLQRCNPFVDLTLDYCRNTAFLYHMFRSKPMF